MLEIFGLCLVLHFDELMLFYNHYNGEPITFCLIEIKQLDSFEHWEAATFILRRSGFQVQINKTETVQIAERFSENLSVCLTKTSRNLYQRPPSSRDKGVL